MRWMWLACCAGIALAQGTDPKPKPEDYPVSARAGEIGIGAEFMAHSFGGSEGMFLAKDYLVVEVALYPPKGQTFTVAAAQFYLRINGKKPLLMPQPPTMVAASLRHPEWSPSPNLEADAGITGAVARIGAPRAAEPFPGSPPAGRRRQVPTDPPNPAGIEPRAPVRADELAIETALVEGDHHTASSGFLYFPYKGRIGSIKTLELTYGETVLKLR